MQITTKTVHKVGHSEMDRAVTEFFGLPYSVVLAEEGDNDSAVSVEVDGGDLDEWDADKIKQWQESGLEGHSPRAGVVLNAMAKDGAIPTGEYRIQICW